MRKISSNREVLIKDFTLYVDDVLEGPHRVVALWCEALGIPFVPEALSWDPGARNEVSWWDGGSFHANLRSSDGLKPQPRTAYIDISQAPMRV